MSVTCKGAEMSAELTYALDGRILGVELPAGGHGRDVGGKTESLLSSRATNMLAAVKMVVVRCSVVDCRQLRR